MMTNTTSFENTVIKVSVNLMDSWHKGVKLLG